MCIERFFLSLFSFELLVGKTLNSDKSLAANIFTFVAIAFDALAGYTFAQVARNHGMMGSLVYPRCLDDHVF